MEEGSIQTLDLPLLLLFKIRISMDYYLIIVKSILWTREWFIL